MKSRAASFHAMLVALLVVLACSPATASSPRVFQFESDEFWLNLHTFLYVLGRAQNHFPDATRDAVKDAPEEAQRALTSLSDSERQAWAECVAEYAKSISRRDPVQDRDLALLQTRLADLHEARSLRQLEAEATLRSVLERAAPIYRKAWWPAHHASNRAWVAQTEKLVAAHGASVLAFITHAYGMSWPSAGYPVHVVRYANWAGAYSTYGDLLLLSSSPAAQLLGFSGLETVFHEGMHQWDDAVQGLLDAQARAAGVQLPRALSHAMIFLTAGEAVRRVAPAGYVPVAESAGVWQRGMMSLKAAVDDAWLPYLNGSGTRDAALAALVRRAAVTSPPQAGSSPSSAPVLFTFSTDDFWLNLHHFLHALGVIHAKLPDASRPALAPAGPNMQRGLQRLNAEQRRVWAEMVERYSKEWSPKPPSVNPAMVGALADAGDAPTLAGTNIDPAIRQVLEAAAPLYRAAWWSEHRDGNRSWQAQLEPLLARYGTDVQTFVTRAFAMEWPQASRRIQPSNRLGIWDQKLSGSPLPASRLKEPLLEAWKPYLDGRGTREEALEALMARAAAVAAAPAPTRSQ